MRAAPLATSLICSTLEARVPSRRAWCSHVTRLYRLRMRHSEVSAVSSTDAAGTLQTAIPERQPGGVYHLAKQRIDPEGTAALT